MAKPNKYAPKAERFRRKAFRVDKMISWLLILIVSTAPFQSSIAMNSDINVPVQENQVLVTQHQETVSTSDSQSCIVNFCQSFSACTAHLNCNPVVSSGSPQLLEHAQFFYHHLIADVALYTRYPDLFKRPPKS